MVVIQGQQEAEEATGRGEAAEHEVTQAAA
jgi:hypothetical protein